MTQHAEQEAASASTQPFPNNFTWGVATASYQIEGATNADGRAPSIWDTFARIPGRVLNGDTGDTACDHYHRWPEDVQLMSSLGVQVYRFSLAWPRLQGDGRGPLNLAGVEFYDRLLDGLLEAGIRPWVTLYHWDLPQALEDAGGWPHRDTAYRFADYAAAVHARFADRITEWTTLNEPWCSAFLGYAGGQHAPGRTEPPAAVRAAHHLLLGHGLAVQAMRTARSDNRYGITLNLYPTTPASSAAADVDAARRVDGVTNRLFLDPVLRGRYPPDVLETLEPVAGLDHLREGDEDVISTSLDFLGVNYYARRVVRFVREEERDRDHPEWIGCPNAEQVGTGKPTTQMGPEWEIDPSGLYDELYTISTDYGPIPLYVTENGAAFPDVVGEDGGVHDPERIAYLDGHFRAAWQAIADGVDLRGYFVWSLLDNFEWAWGYTRRFGLVYVDYATQRRIVKDSGHWFTRVIADNRVGGAASRPTDRPRM
jgi:beta-glucosidase